VARTVEAFAVYHRKKELLSDYLQVASAGLALLRRNIGVPNAPTLLGSLVDACGIRYWGKGKAYKNAPEKVDVCLAALAEQGVIQQVAAFDLFTRSLVQDLARFSARARSQYNAINHDHHLLKVSPAGRWVSAHCCNDLAGRLGTLSPRLDDLQQWIGWTPSVRLSPTLPLFQFICTIRNGIAHSDGLVGAALEEFSSSREIADALTAFRRGYARGDLPPLPPFVRGRSLQLETIHSILFGALLYEIAKELNSHAVDLLDDSEFIDMAFYYSCVVDEHSFRTVRHRSAENRVCYFLAERYLRDGNPPGTNTVIRRLTAQRLQAADGVNTTLWQVALERHATLLEG
jgi:hypothetical protein